MMALSYERAVLASDLPALKEIITDKEDGFLFKAEDTDSLSIKLNDILADNELLEAVRIKGSKLINTKYNWDNIGTLTKKAYNTIY